MEYIQDVLDRATGQLQTQSLGDWITVTELGQRYGVGKRKVRAILHHMGVLGREGRCYRLSRPLVEAGLGRRHDFTRSGHAFDVISPKGQQAIASMWSSTLQNYEAEQQRVCLAPAVRAALDNFKTTRLRPMETQEEVCWIFDHFREADHQTIAAALEVSPALVSRYVKRRAVGRADRERKKQEALPTRVEAIDRMRQLAPSGSIPLGD